MKNRNEKQLNNQLNNELTDAFKTHDIAVVWNKKNILFNFLQFQSKFQSSSHTQYHNQKHSQEHNQKIVAVTIKNDLYGAPLEKILPYLPCNDFFGSTLQECIEAQNIFQQNIIKLDPLQQDTQKHYRIYMLHGFIPGQEDELNKHKIIPCINSVSQLKIWHEKFPHNPYVLHIDTGMSRHGISLQEAKEPAQEFSQKNTQYTSKTDVFQCLQNPEQTERPESIQLHDYLKNALFYMTHFYGIKEDLNNFSTMNFPKTNTPKMHLPTTNTSNANIYNSHSTFFKQIQKLKQFLKILPSKPISFSATDTAMALYFTEFTEFTNDIPTENIIRPGVGIVGGVPTQDYLHFLKIAFSVFTRISSITKVPAGENISYGLNSYNEDKTIGVINIGYGDGYMKILNGTYVCVHFKSEHFNYQKYQKIFCKTIAINLNCSVIDCSEFPKEMLKSFHTAIVELCGENIDIREFAIKNGCYQVYALGSKGKNKKTLCIE